MQQLRVLAHEFLKIGEADIDDKAMCTAYNTHHSPHVKDRLTRSQTLLFCGGRYGIRTHGDNEATMPFQGIPFGRSGNLPDFYP